MKNIGEWPDNLIGDVVAYSRLVGRTLIYGEKPKDFDGSLEYVVATFLTPRELSMIRMRYQSRLTLDDIANEHGITRERARQIIGKAVRKLSRVSIFEFFSLGVQGVITKRAIENQIVSSSRDVSSVPLEEIGLSCRAYNCLIRYGARTLEDVLNLDIDDFARVRNAGAKTIREIISIREAANETR